MWRKGIFLVGCMIFGIVAALAETDVVFRRVDGRWGVNATGPGSHGALIADFDQDGDHDIYVTSFWTDTPHRNLNQFFIRENPLQFVDRAKALGVEMRDSQTHDAVWLDYDGDGRLDLFVAATIGRHRLFRQTASGFVDVSSRAGVNRELNAEARGVAAGDVNGDGWTDLFIVNNGHAHQLFINQGDGTFRDAAASRGVSDFRPLPHPPNDTGIGQGVTMVDYDDDGDLDIFVCVRNMNPRLFVNRGDGYFTESAIELGIRAPDGCDGAMFGDLDNDGDLDLVATRAEITRLMLFYQTAQGRFDDRSRAYEILGNAFSPVLVDLNSDGFLDILYARRDRSLAVYLNDGRGDFQYVDVGIHEVGEDPRAVAVADFDQDGDLDVMIVHKRDNHRIFENRVQAPWLALRIEGDENHTDLYGTKVFMYDSEWHLRGYQQITSSYGYLAHSPPNEVHFGLPSVDVRLVRIRYPWGVEVLGIALPNMINLFGPRGRIQVIQSRKDRLGSGLCLVCPPRVNRHP